MGDSVTEPGALMILAGGTGGHVYPALAVAERLRAAGVPVVWLGTERGLEARLVPAAGFPIEFVRVSGLRGSGLGGWLRLPGRLLLACRDSLSAMRRHRVRTVLGFGGFVSGPGGLVAWGSRRPLLIHEQNALPGLSNRWLARLSVQAMEAFAGAFPQRLRAVHTGNPVRPALAAVPAPALRFAGRTGPLRLLVLGGSQGAHALNALLPQALAMLPEAERPSVRHQCGERHLDTARAAYDAAGLPASAVRLTPYIEDMAEAYAWADVALCRSGAMTLAELAVVGLGGLLVPFPAAADDHQTVNARYLAEQDAARLLPQADLTPERLAEALQALGRDRATCERMAVAARALGVPDAADRVAAECLAVHGNREQQS